MKLTRLLCLFCITIALCSRGAVAAEPTVKSAYDFTAKTLKYVEASAKRPELAARLTALKSRLDKTPISEILKLRREIILSHPALAFDSLLINKRPVSRVKNHMVDHYLGRFSLPGEGLVILKDWKTDPKQTFITSNRSGPLGPVMYA